MSKVRAQKKLLMPKGSISEMGRKYLHRALRHKAPRKTLKVMRLVLNRGIKLCLSACVILPEECLKSDPSRIRIRVRCINGPSISGFREGESPPLQKSPLLIVYELKD